MIDTLDVLRIFNAVVLGILLVGLLVSAYVYRRHPLNIMGVALVLFAASGLYSTVEALVLGAPGGVRSVTVLLVGVIAVTVVYTPLVGTLMKHLRKRKEFKATSLK